MASTAPVMYTCCIVPATLKLPVPFMLSEIVALNPRDLQRFKTCWPRDFSTVSNLYPPQFTVPSLSIRPARSFNLSDVLATM